MIASRSARNVFRDALSLGTRSLAIALLTWILGCIGTAAARQVEPSPLSLYGMTGIIDMPTARMMDDGELAITGETKQPDDRITIAFQALPWLEATARYSIISRFAGPEGNLFDRSLGFKLKLMNEGQYRPSLAMGVLDIGGTEIFGAEYFVTSKRFGPFDTSLGLGFGRFGSSGMFKNPLGLISDKFYTRPGITSINDTGRFALKEFFRGPDASLFGGVVYNTPLPGLQLLAEYSGDKYANEQQRRLVKIKSQVNVGASYRPLRFLELGAYWMYGHELALRLSLRSNLETADLGPKLDAPPVPIHVRTDEEIQDGRLASALDVGPKMAAAATLKRGDRSLENDLDWGSDPPFDAEIQEVSAGGPDLKAVNAVPFARIKAQLEALDMTLAGYGFDDSQVVISVVPQAGQAPLPCEVMWHQISIGGLVGVNAVTFVNSADGREVNRCTKFLEPVSAALASARQLGPSGDARDGAMTVSYQIADTSSGVTGAIPGASTSLASNDEDNVVLARRIRQVFAYQGLSLEAFKLNGSEAIIYVYNTSYQRVGRALGRAARALTSLLPPKVEMITLIQTNGAIVGDVIKIPRTELERVAVNGGSAEEILNSSTVSPGNPQIVDNADFRRRRFLRFYPILAPSFRESLFDPDDPFRYQFLVRAGGTIELMRGFSIDGAYDINLYNNFNTIRRVSDSVLPHVRSDFRYYLQDGASGVESLQFTLMHQFSPALTSRLSVGYLEQMYGGIAGEVLYAPFDQRWAIGIDLAAVKQRDFDGKFGFRNYKTVTGHLELYYQTPFHNIDLHFLYGRYLAKDWGTTIELSRRFSNGAEVSAWATFTNVPFAKFGEGSFDKGIRITLPLDFYSLFSSRISSSVELRPVTRDGGAVLNDGPKLYPIVRSLSYGEAYRSFNDFLSNR